MSDNNEFVKSIENATLKIVLEASKNMEKACLLVEREAKKNCPVDQGILRASIQHDVNFNDAEIVGTVFSSLEYAPYVHQGTGIYAVNGDGRKTPWRVPEIKKGKYKGEGFWTRGQKANPFLDKAKLDNKDKILKILAGD